MKTRVLFAGIAMSFFGITNAQINVNDILNERALGAVQKGMSGFEARR